MTQSLWWTWTLKEAGSCFQNCVRKWCQLRSYLREQSCHHFAMTWIGIFSHPQKSKMSLQATHGIACPYCNHAFLCRDAMNHHIAMSPNCKQMWHYNHLAKRELWRVSHLGQRGTTGQADNIPPVNNNLMDIDMTDTHLDLDAHNGVEDIALPPPPRGLCQRCTQTVSQTIRSTVSFCTWSGCYFWRGQDSVWYHLQWTNSARS